MDLIKLGNAEIHRVEEMSYRLPTAMMTEDEALISANLSWLIPRFMDADRQFELITQSWLLLVDDKIIVIDPCTGNARDLEVLPFFHQLDTPYIERFCATGIRPEHVDIVVCTHLHCDHCGWNTQLRDGRYVPTFPNARYIFAQRECDRWNPKAPGYRAEDAFNAGVFENSVRPILEAGLADLVDGSRQISSSVSFEPAYGHTAGHSVVHLATPASEAYFVGDAIQHPLQIVDPTIDHAGCEDLPQATETRRRLLTACADRNALLVPAHFPAPHAGWIHRDGDRFGFQAYAG
jgi:glyoxylase-like metal-dependent hydrolase (beta-lactamase superfamily II)